MLASRPTVFVDANLWVYAHLKAPGDGRHRLALDCHVAAAAIVAGCKILLTEDLQHGQVLDESLQVFNPLLGAAARG